jgi:hypothetical protein
MMVSPARRFGDHSPRMVTDVRTSLCLVCVLFLACDAGTSSTSDASGGSGGSGNASSVGGSTGNFGGAGGDGGAGGGGEEVAEVFGHSASVLYRLDPDTKQITTVGTFSNCDGSVIDIALDKDSNLYGTTPNGLFRINKTNAACMLVKSGSYPNSLSFIPAGTLDPNVEALVGYNGSNYIRIDPITGNVSDVGDLGPNGFSSSGDIVSVKGGGTFLTVNGDGCGDCLVEVDPKTGSVIKEWGPLNYSAVYGIAFWAGSVYGFTDAGELFEVTFPNGVLTTTAINVTGANSFYGAGSTTSAPPVAIPD